MLGANAELGLDDVDFDVIAEADFLHLGGTYLMPKLDGEPTAEVLKFARDNGVTTTLDMIATKRDDLFKVSRTLFSSHRLLHARTGRGADDLWVKKAPRGHPVLFG